MKATWIIVSSLLALAACGKSDEKTITLNDETGATATATVSTDEGKVNITTNNGKFTMEQNGSAKFNDGAPQYPGSKITSTMISNNDGKVGGMVAMETNDTPANVMAFYKAKMLAAKRVIAAETTTPEGGMIMSGTDADGLVITVAREKDKTMVAIITGKGY
jgi:hypothetical protein